jgi:hypothetical protein
MHADGRSRMRPFSWGSCSSRRAAVLVFHGFTGSAQGVRGTSGFTALAEEHGFVAAYPHDTREARGNTFFNAGYSFHEREKSHDSTRDIGFKVACPALGSSPGMTVRLPRTCILKSRSGECSVESHAQNHEPIHAH